MSFVRIYNNLPKEKYYICKGDIGTDITNYDDDTYSSNSLIAICF